MEKITIIKYKSKSGKLFDSKEECAKEDNLVICPNCNGRGIIGEAYNAYPEGLPDSGWVEDIMFRNKPCSKCNLGYVKKEKILDTEEYKEYLEYKKKYKGFNK